MMLLRKFMRRNEVITNTWEKNERRKYLLEEIDTKSVDKKNANKDHISVEY